MPPNTVKVDRSTRWGNPFPVGKLNCRVGLVVPDVKSSVGFFRDMLGDPEIRKYFGYPDDLSPLRGKNLACWCKPGELCHADVLLELANKGGK